MSEITLDVVSWAAQECAWQQSGEKSVAWMVGAWDYAMQYHVTDPPLFITLEHVVHIGRLVEPRVNAGGLRRVGVQVGHYLAPHPDLVPQLLTDLLLAQERLTPTEFFRQFEEIHPFRDGNGRTGNILYNWRANCLTEPVFPPNLFGDPRR